MWRQDTGDRSWSAAAAGHRLPITRRPTRQRSSTAAAETKLHSSSACSGSRRCPERRRGTQQSRRTMPAGVRSQPAAHHDEDDADSSTQRREAFWTQQAARDAKQARRDEALRGAWASELEQKREQQNERLWIQPARTRQHRPADGPGLASGGSHHGQSSRTARPPPSRPASASARLPWNPESGGSGRPASARPAPAAAAAWTKDRRGRPLHPAWGPTPKTRTREAAVAAEAAEIERMQAMQRGSSRRGSVFFTATSAQSHRPPTRSAPVAFPGVAKSALLAV